MILAYFTLLESAFAYKPNDSWSFRNTWRTIGLKGYLVPEDATLSLNLACEMGMIRLP